MRLPHGLTLLMAVLAPRQAFAQSSSSATIFLLDAEPQTVEASIIAYTSSGASGQGPVTTLLLSCPSSFAPCLSASIDGATVYHTQGSVFGGTLPNATPTTFYCELGSGTGDTISNQDGRCNRTVGTATTSTALNSPYVSAHQAAMIITAGLEKLSASSTAAPCTSRRQLFSSMLPSPSSGSSGDIWGWAVECPSTTSTSTASMMASQTAAQTSSSATSSKTTPSSSPSPAASTQTKASGASARIAGRFMFAQIVGVAMAWLIL